MTLAATMLARVLEPEVMDSPQEAIDYDSMDHSEVNQCFVSDFITAWRGAELDGFSHSPADRILDLGTGTALIPIELCRQSADALVLGIDLAENMLEIGRRNVAHAGLASRIALERCDAKRLAYPDGHFAAVISNSIVHHIPEPQSVLAEAVRVLRPGGLIFIRDLLRPTDDAGVRHLVSTYAGQANPHQQKMFDDSLRAALNLEEIRAIVKRLGFDSQSVQPTSDRHWTWIARRPQ